MSGRFLSRLAVAVLGSALMAASVVAQDAGILTPQQVLSAIEKNGDMAIAVAEADIAIAQARLDEASAGLRPNVALSATAQVFRPSPAHNYPSDDGEAFGKFSVVQPVYDFGKTRAAEDAAGAEIAAAEHALVSARNTVLMEGLALYYNLHASELQLRALNEAHTSAYLKWNRAKDNLEMGRTSPLDVAQELSKAERSRLNLYRERSRNAALRLRLQELTGEALPEELISPPKAPMDKPLEVDRDAFAKLVIERNPEIRALDKQVEAAALRREGVGSYPRLDAFGEVGSTSRELRGRNDFAVGARLSWPIFDGGMNNAKKARIAAEESRIITKREAKKRDLRIKAYELLMERGDAFQRVIAARAMYAYTDKNLLMRQQLYQQERVADLGNAMIEHTGSEAELVRATGAYFMVMARIAMTLGEHPGRGLESGFLTGITGLKAAPQGGFVPKSGTGFGQEDQDQVIRKPQVQQ